MTSSTLANEFATDTMALVLRIEKRKTGQKAKDIFSSVEAGTAKVYVPAMVFAEVLYLSQKGRINITLSASNKR